MRRAFLLILGITLLTWLEFEVYPGHTYLRGDTQIYVPVLERLEAPGFLSRDLIASSPHVAYTVYDEVTLLLHTVGHADLQRALEGQQLISRAAAILGVFLLGLSTGLTDLLAFTLAALVNLGATLCGPAVSLVERESIPQGIAIGILLLALGLLAREKPLLGGFAAGVALLYDIVISAPVWIVILAGLLFNPRLRRLMRPASTIFWVFLLLLANLAQLQPGEVEPENWAAHISPALAALQQFRTPFAWVSHWDRGDLWAYLFIYVCGIWAVARLWPVLNRQVRWFFTWLPLYGVLSVPLCYFLLEHFHWGIIAQLQPARSLALTIGISSIACGVCAVRAAMVGLFLESAVWFLVLFSIASDTRVFELLNLSRLWQGGACLALAIGAALLARKRAAERLRAAVLLVPIAAMLMLARVQNKPRQPLHDDSALDDMAEWAEKSTWGNSMFLFADAGDQIYPGIFRAKSRRAVWVDWMSGKIMTYSEGAGSEWWVRWQQTMHNGLTPEQLRSRIAISIDYCVLERAHSLPGVRPAFSNREFVVYDAHDLKSYL